MENDGKKRSGKKTGRRRKRKIRKRSHFYRNLLIVFLILLLPIDGGLVWLWNQLEDYQACLPSNQTDEVEQAFHEGDMGALLSWATGLPEELRKPERLRDFLEGAYVAEDVFCYADSLPGDAKLQYAVADDTRRFATLTLAPDPEPSGLGRTSYHIDSLQFDISRTYTFIAPSDVTVTVNGQPLSEKYLISDTEPMEHLVQIGLPAVSERTYVIEGMYLIDTVSAEGCSEKETDPGVWELTRIVTEEEKEQVSSLAEAFVKEYTVFSLKKNAPRTPVLPYVYRGSKLYDSILAYDNDWGIEYSSAEYQSYEIGNFQKYGENGYSCEVSFAYVVSGRGKEKTFDFHVALYVTNLNGEWKIVDMYNL